MPKDYKLMEDENTKQSTWFKMPLKIKMSSDFPFFKISTNKKEANVVNSLGDLSPPEYKAAKKEEKKEEKKHVTISEIVKKANVVDPLGKLSPRQHKKAYKAHVKYDETKTYTVEETSKIRQGVKEDMLGIVDDIKNNKMLTEDRESIAYANKGRKEANESFPQSKYTRENRVKDANADWGIR